jgi:hypothetical protein
MGLRPAKIWPAWQRRRSCRRFLGEANPDLRVLLFALVGTFDAATLNTQFQIAAISLQ